jgi:hypothetical protein
MFTTCSTCRFCEHELDEKRLACHRMPPPWPTVFPHSWCGEWAAKDHHATQSDAEQLRSPAH